MYYIPILPIYTYVLYKHMCYIHIHTMNIYLITVLYTHTYYIHIHTTYRNVLYTHIRNIYTYVL